MIINSFSIQNREIENLYRASDQTTEEIKAFKSKYNNFVSSHNENMIRIKKLVLDCANALKKVEGIQNINQINNHDFKNNNNNNDNDSHTNNHNNNKLENNNNNNNKERSKNIVNIQQTNNYDNSVKVMITGEDVYHPVTNKPISLMLKEKIIEERTPYKTIETVENNNNNHNEKENNKCDLTKKMGKNENETKTSFLSRKLNLEEERYKKKVKEYCQNLKDLKVKYDDNSGCAVFQFIDKIIIQMEEEEEYIF